MSTKLVFTTPSQPPVSIPAGQTTKLGVVDVSPFSRIRVVAVERPGSATGVSIRLTLTEAAGLIAQLDVLKLTPNSQVTHVYEAPGTKLTIFAAADAGTGSDVVDVLVYGAD